MSVMAYSQVPAPFPAIALPDRRWADARHRPRARSGAASICATATKPWSSRWGPDRKRRMFDLSWSASASRKSRVGFPSASENGFRFLSAKLVEHRLVPDDVHDPSIDSGAARVDRAQLRGDPGAHGAPSCTSTNSTSTLQRRVVFGLDKPGIVDHTHSCPPGARLIPRPLAATMPETEVICQIFSGELYWNRARFRRRDM